MFQELSAKVDKTSYQAAVNKTKELYSLCNSSFAWEFSNMESYKECTDQIIRSSTKIQRKIKSIESYSLNHSDSISIQAELEQVLEDIALEPNPSKGLERVLNFIENESLTVSHSQPCFERNCLEAIREVVIRLKMIEWGIFGLGSASAGLYISEYFIALGSYFGDLGESNWPHIPLHKKPTSLENDFNQLLTNITFIMSNGTLENVSLLDLPAFGSTVVTLRQDLKKQFTWPIETNHALLTQNSGLNMTNFFTEYKTLVEDWAQHMKGLGRSSSGGQFTLDMKKNKHLNFTRFIKKDMKMFLIALSGNKCTYFSFSVCVL